MKCVASLLPLSLRRAAGWCRRFLQARKAIGHREFAQPQAKGTKRDGDKRKESGRVQHRSTPHFIMCPSLVKRVSRCVLRARTYGPALG